MKNLSKVVVLRMEIAIVTVIVVLILGILFLRTTKWTVIESGRGERVSIVYAKHEFLRTRKLKSRIVNAETGQLNNGSEPSIRLEVPEKSIKQVLEALEEFD
jgi:hypothetical protein